MKLKLLVLKTNEVELMRRLLEAIGFETELEKHGTGPEHYSATFPDGLVLEVYPSKNESLTEREFLIGLEMPDVDTVIPKIVTLGLRWKRVSETRIRIHAPEGGTFELEAA